jgi:tetratricopeptide (TPR) repeat protein
MKMQHRRMAIFAALGFFASAFFGAPASAQTPQHQHYEKANEAHLAPSPAGQLAPRLQNLGTHAFPVSCTGENVQAFFNQGVNLSYGFNHAEAGRAFREAARLAPDCAMAYWGQALVLGPNINAPMDAAAEPQAFELVQKALALKSKATPREQDYIAALAKRYSGKAEDRAKNDRAYADAMRALSQKYPDDLEAATLFAEALMDLRPWNYWTRDGQPYAETTEAVEVVEAVMRRHADHPGALHLYIHLMEPTKNPEKAEMAADRLLPLVPGAGHMVHMPSHIYMRIGRYADARKSNELAVLADEDYITQCRAQGMYPLGYYPHNIHFLWWAATHEGNSRTAIESARKVASKISVEAAKEMPFLQGFLAVPYYAMVRFGKWEDILREPRPAFDSPFTRGLWHYARGTAFVATGRTSEAERELAELASAVRDSAVAGMPASFSENTADKILPIALNVLAGDVAARKGETEKALYHLDTAVRLEDALIYNEPADWHLPVRQVLGAVLLAAGRAAEAEVVYWEDLKRNPENGWSLKGLAQALRAQGKDEQAAHAEQRLAKAWANADVQLAASRF